MSKDGEEEDIHPLLKQLWKIAHDGKLKELEKFLHKHKDDDNLDLKWGGDYFDEDGGNVLTYCVKAVHAPKKGHGHSVASKDREACCKLFIEKGVRLDYQDKAGRTPLSWAVVRRCDHLVSMLLKLGADATIQDQDGYTPFHLATQNGSKECLKILLEETQEAGKLLDKPDRSGVPPIIHAVKRGYVDICKFLLDHGADINACERKNNRTALFHAISSKHHDLFELLLKSGAKVDTADSEGQTILYLCCDTTDNKFFHQLVHFCPHFSASLMDRQAEDGTTAVIVACQHGNAEKLKKLLDDGASLDVTDNTGKTALHYCADNLETQCAEMLLEKDISLIDEKDEQGYTAMHMAVLAGNDNLLKLLLEKGANLNSKDDDNHTVSHWATVSGHLKILDILIEAKADFTQPDSHNAYPIHYAAQMNGRETQHQDPKIGEKVLKKLLDIKVPMDVVDKDGRPPLLWAASSGNAESCKMLLKEGADINVVDKDGLSALHCAASRGHANCIETLKKAGADCNLADTNKCTPIFYAITLGNKECTKLLLKSGANPNHVDNRGRSPAHCAAIKGCLDTIKLLEKEKGDLWMQSTKGDYPIHEAAQGGHLDVVKYLLRLLNTKDAVNYKNHAGRTALHLGAITNNLQLCKLLINQDADMNPIMTHKDKQYTPYDIAVLKGYKDLGDFLKSRGGKPFSDLANEQKREARSAKSRQSGLETTQEEDHEADKKGKPKEGDVVLTPITDKGKEKGAKGKKDAESGVDQKDAGTTAVIAAGDKGKDKKGKKGEKGVGGSQTVVKEATTVAATPKKEKDLKSEKAAKGKEAKETEQDSPDSKDKKGKLYITGIDWGDKKGKEEPEKKEAAVGKSTTNIAVETDKVEEKGRKSKDLKDKDSKQGKPATGKKVKREGSRESVIRVDGQGTETSKETGNVDASTQQDRFLVVDASTQKNTESPSVSRQTTDLQPKVMKDKEEEEKERKPVSPTKKPEDAENVGREAREPREGYRTRRKYVNSMDGIVDAIRGSVRLYQDTRNASRQMHHLKRAKIYTGPMHDIVMFSKMMDVYRKAQPEEEEEEGADMDLRPFANWDGYLQDQLKFVSHFYDEDKPQYRPISAVAKEQGKRLEKEASRGKKKTDGRVYQLNEDAKKDEEREKKRRYEMEKKMEQLTKKTAEMFDNVNDEAEQSMNTAKSTNKQLTGPDEEADRLEQQEKERKAKHKEWHKKKDKEMQQRLLQAYRPQYPPDVFKKHGNKGKEGSKSARNGDSSSEPPGSGRERKISPEPRPKSAHKNHLSAAQYRLRDDSTKVTMTPYGLRRVRVNENGPYDEEDDFVDEPHFIIRGDYEQANWSRKFDGNIRPRTGLIFVNPHVYDEIVKDEKEMKQIVAFEAKHKAKHLGEIVKEAGLTNGAPEEEETNNIVTNGDIPESQKTKKDTVKAKKS